MTEHDPVFEDDIIAKLVIWLEGQEREVEGEALSADIDLDLLSGYLAGSLTEQSRTRVEELLVKRPDLRQVLSTVAAAPGAPEAAQGAGRGRPPAHWGLALAAAALLVAGLLVVFHHANQRSPELGTIELAQSLRADNPGLLDDLSVFNEEELESFATDQVRSASDIPVYFPRGVELSTSPTFSWEFADAEAGAAFDLELMTDEGTPLLDKFHRGVPPLAFPPIGPLAPGQSYIWIVSTGPEGELVEGDGAFRVASDEERKRWEAAARTILSRAAGVTGDLLVIQLAMRRSYIREAFRLARDLSPAQPADDRMSALYEAILLRLGVPHARHIARAEAGRLPVVLQRD